MKKRILFVLMGLMLLGSAIGINTTKASAASPKLSATTASIKKGDTKTLKLKNVSGKVTWSSNNKSVATVDSKGKIKTYKKGSAKITAKYKNKNYVCKVSVITRKQTDVYKKIMTLKDKYYEGMKWTNDNGPYKSNYENVMGYGCYGFAAIVSDKAFGWAKASTHKSFDKIKVGDNIRIGNWHSVIVLKKTSSSITVVEGNYNKSIHWGRTIMKSSLQKDGFSVTTRY